MSWRGVGVLLRVVGASSRLQVALIECIGNCACRCVCVLVFDVVVPGQALGMAVAQFRGDREMKAKTDKNSIFQKGKENNSLVREFFEF